MTTKSAPPFFERERKIHYTCTCSTTHTHKHIHDAFSKRKVAFVFVFVGNILACFVLFLSFFPLEFISFDNCERLHKETSQAERERTIISCVSL